MSYFSIYRSVDGVIEEIQDMRNTEAEDDTGEGLLYYQAVKLAEEIGVEPSIPRKASRQQHRSNAPATSCPEHYRRNLILPFIDGLINEMRSRYWQMLSIN